MSFRRLVASALVLGTLITFIPNGVTWAKAVPPVRLAGSAIPFTRALRVIGVVPGSRRLTIQVWLTPRDQAGAERYALDVSTPGNRLFHHYLTPDAYARRFGGSASTVDAMVAWLRRAGLSRVAAGGQLAYVRATGSVSTVDAAFGVRLLEYRASAQVRADRGLLYANDRAVRVPAALAGSVLAVTGLADEAVRPMSEPAPPSAADRTRKIPCSHYYGQHRVGGLPRQFGQTSFPTSICGYTAWQLRHALGANQVNAGRGQTVALIEVGLARGMFPVLRDYARASHLPPPARARYAQLNLTSRPSCGDPFFATEEHLDVEAAYALAPGAHELTVGANSCSSDPLQALDDALLRVLEGPHDRPLASIVSNSWDDPGPVTAAQTRLISATLVQAAAEGVGMYFAAGDHPGVQMPADQSFAMAVGGTSLGIGRRGQRLFQTGWSSGVYSVSGRHWTDGMVEAGTGGGPSPEAAEPAYQKGVVPAALTKGSGLPGARRTVPDLSEVGDFATPMAVGFQGQSARYYETGVGGTSLATPLVAGLVADAQQGQAKPFGFLNPVFYRLAGTRAFLDVLPLTRRSPAGYRGLICATGNTACSNGPGGPALNRLDDQSGQLEGYRGQVTLKGYDNMTGLGTPDGQAFIAALRRLAG
jgi:subtilase family serine protease